MECSFWQFLGLDPAAATVADVEIGYYRLLLEHHPSRSPQKFQLLQQARAAALREIASRQENSAGESKGDERNILARSFEPEANHP